MNTVDFFQTSATKHGVAAQKVTVEIFASLSKSHPRCCHNTGVWVEYTSEERASSARSVNP